ncbi:B12-binding domain-containing radical SAM protein [Mesoterricola silvestris]|uniref:Radical SAM protein n=1 Tax=Mesoterricola silvestris TaxID=2927979 RepID=A0AA48GQ01_9BACT|nr:radical SAM protein [Mesoterricola silvestris]BDU73585.1 hypothetical protein METEAL_27590 [Mesoterricola silvestris]
MPRDPVMFVMAPGGDLPAFSEHLGAAYLRAVLRGAGIGAGQYLPPAPPTLPDFATLLRAQRPAIVGFTVYETNLYLSRILARIVREVLPETAVLVGGPNATFSPEETLELLGADGVVRGAGETLIVPLAERILARGRTGLAERLADLPNLVLASPGGPRATAITQLSSFPEGLASLDDLPSPYQLGLVASPRLGYLTARGCDQHCTFCSFAAVSGHRIAFHSVERVLDDLEALAARFGGGARPPRVQLYDDAFTIRPGRARRICEGILDRGLRLELTAMTRADRVDADLLRLMRRAGFTGLCFGLESGSPRVLRAIGKVRAPETRVDPELARERGFLDSVRAAVAAAREAGMDVETSVIRGLPGETAEDWRATTEFVGSLGLEACADNILSLMPGTPLHRSRRRFGLDARRDPASQAWVTTHAHAVGSWPPVPGSSLFQRNWREGQALADALCGRVPEGPGSGAAVVVAHGLGPTPAFAGWLSQVLALGGLLLVLDSPEEEAPRWAAALARASVPYGACRLLRPAEEGGYRLELLGGAGAHRVTLLDRWDRDQALAPLSLDAAGACRMTVGLASAPGFHPAPLGEPGDVPFLGPGLQVADACRWRPGPPRCRHLRAVHVFADGAVRPCWHGPRLGTLGDPWTALLAAADRHSCPLATEGNGATLAALDLASQMAWLFPPRRGPGPSPNASDNPGADHGIHE